MFSETRESIEIDTTINVLTREGDIMPSRHISLYISIRIRFSHIVCSTQGNYLISLLDALNVLSFNVNYYAQDTGEEFRFWIAPGYASFLRSSSPSSAPEQMHDHKECLLTSIASPILPF